MNPIPFLNDIYRVVSASGIELYIGTDKDMAETVFVTYAPCILMLNGEELKRN